MLGPHATEISERKLFISFGTINHAASQPHFQPAVVGIVRSIKLGH